MSVGTSCRPLRVLSGCAALLALAGTASCQSAADRAPVPAVLSSTSAEISAELATAATQLLEGRKVALGQNAFTQHNSLTLEPAMRNTPLGRLASGRTIEEPDALRLLRVGRKCVLEHINSGRQTTLTLTDCVADEQANKD